MSNANRLMTALTVCAAPIMIVAAFVFGFVPNSCPFRLCDNAAEEHAVHHPMNAVPSSSMASARAESAFYEELAQANGRMHEAMDVAPTADFDRDFARVMIPHHQGAIDMSLVFLKYGHDERLKRLAQAIIVEQGEEIAYMRTLLGSPSTEASATDRGIGK